MGTTRSLVSTKFATSREILVTVKVLFVAVLQAWLTRPMWHVTCKLPQKARPLRYLARMSRESRSCPTLQAWKQSLAMATVVATIVPSSLSQSRFERAGLGACFVKAKLELMIIRL